MKTDYLSRHIETYAFDETLTGRHMVFLAGPRQVGKTALARNWLKRKECERLYFNWDDPSTRQAYLGDSRFFESPARSLGKQETWIAFDEIHKRNKWRDILKGAFDVFGHEFRFLVTGSARLDLFRRSGDSLVGRYSLFNMFPFNIPEVVGTHGNECFLEKKPFKTMTQTFQNTVEACATSEIADAYNTLKQYGPFPEPFLMQTDRFSRKWHNDYFSLLVRQDLRDLSRVEELDKIEHMLILLPSRLMNPLSMASLARELEVAHTTVKNWLEQVRRLFLVFSVSPWSKKINRGLKKEKKWYFLDWFYAPEGPARLENMVATSLYRTCVSMTDMGLGNYRLHYVRTLDKKEIDFLITRDQIPVMAVEVKVRDTSLSRPLKDRQKWFPDNPVMGIQVVDQHGIFQVHSNHTWVMSADRFLAALP